MAAGRSAARTGTKKGGPELAVGPGRRFQGCWTEGRSPEPPYCRGNERGGPELAVASGAVVRGH
jgi:hypothetical protein